MKRRENSQSGAGDVVRRDDYNKNEIRSMKDIVVEDLPDYGFFTPEVQATIFHDIKQLAKRFIWENFPPDNCMAVALKKCKAFQQVSVNSICTEIRLMVRSIEVW